MKVVIITGSAHKNGTSAYLTDKFIEGAKEAGHEIYRFDAAFKQIHPCLGCDKCRTGGAGCVFKDDVYDICEKIMDCRMIVLASPIYSWYCTAPMKIVLDRLVYGMNKIYSEKPGPQLWKGRKMALITTCGYPPEKGADLSRKNKEHCHDSKAEPFHHKEPASQ